MSLLLSSRETITTNQVSVLNNLVDVQKINTFRILDSAVNLFIVRTWFTDCDHDIYRANASKFLSYWFLITNKITLRFVKFNKY